MGVRLDDVWFRYHRRGPWVLRAVSLRIGPGEVAVVLGRNGVGKSTLLQLAAGVLRPVRGTARDRPAVVGWAPEHFPAEQPFAVADYLTAMGRVGGLSADAAARATDEWTQRLGIAGYRRIRLPELSKGTAQKVGLAQAMLRRPALLVLDEPWEGLDAEARELVPTLIDEVLGAGGSVLVSDHRGETVQLPAARRWTVADGAVVEDEPAADGPVSVIEVTVPSARVAGAVAALRAAGHQVLRVRGPASGVDGPAAETGVDGPAAETGVDGPAAGPVSGAGATR